MLRHLRTCQDLTRDEIWKIFELAKDLKEKQKSGQSHKLLEGKSLAMIFQKPSTRTRVSFETAMTQLGGHALYLSSADLQLSRGESIEDTARTLSRYVDGILARVFDHHDIVKLAKNSSVPVINGLSNDFHPCQALTDLFTIWEKKGNLENLTIAFASASLDASIWLFEPPPCTNISASKSIFPITFSYIFIGSSILSLSKRWSNS